MERAYASLEEAKTLHANDFVGGAISRLYYSCFYAVLSFLTQKGISAKSHTGIKSAFNLHLIKSGLLPIALGMLYNELFELRLEADYVPEPSYLADEIGTLLSQAEGFIQTIHKITNSLE